MKDSPYKALDSYLVFHVIIKRKIIQTSVMQRGYMTFPVPQIFHNSVTTPNLTYMPLGLHQAIQKSI